MYSRLEIFPDKGIVTSAIHPTPTISLPSSFRNVSITCRTAKGSLMPGSINLNRRISTFKLRDGQTLRGYLAKLELQGENVICDISNPISEDKIISKVDEISTPNNNDWSLEYPEGTHTIILQFELDISWVPVYQVILGKTPDIVDYLSLSAAITNKSSETFDVEDIIFSSTSLDTEPVAAPSRNRMAIASAQMTSEYVPFESKTITSADNPIKYSVGRTKINRHNLVNVWGRTSILQKRVYTLRLGTDKVMYGYRFDAKTFYLPPGQLKILDSDFTTIKHSFFEGSNKGNTDLNIDQSYDIQVAAVVTSSSGPMPKITYDLIIVSQKTEQIELILTAEYNNYKSVTADPSVIIDPLRSEMFWSHQILPGKNKISGSYVVEY